MSPPPLLAIYSSFSAFGGVSRMMVNLANAWVDAGFKVHLLLSRGICPFPELLHEGVTPVDLGRRHNISNFLPLVRYLRREKPEALLAVKFNPIQTALLANMVAGNVTRVVPRLDVAIEASLPSGQLKRWSRLWPIRHLYPRAPAIVALSAETSNELRALSPSIDSDRIHVIANPVITPDMEELAREPADHPWTEDRQVALVVAAGRFTHRKDFPTLLRAFAIVRAQRPARLIILGDGPERKNYEALIAELGITRDVALPGYRKNPFAYFSRASLFVLSSRSEGSPNVLTEAMALGTPVVATDCPFGPRSLLRDGKLGQLVPVGNAQAMAHAILNALANKPSGQDLKNVVVEFRTEISAQRYLNALGFTHYTK